MNYGLNTFRLRIALAATIFALAGSAFGQTPDEHAKHHPAPGGANPAPAAAGSMGGSQPNTAAGNGNPGSAQGSMGGNQPAGAGGGGMGGMMGEMMKQMGVPPRKELYPSLMALPDQVTPEQRAEIQQLAQERMNAGTAMLSSGLERLLNSTSGEDYAAMQQGAAQMRQGLAEFEAGIAARRILSEGKAPRNLALDWFKREMNLASPVRLEERSSLLGVTPYHLFTMALLIAFALAMVAMYFFKMRRTAALFGRLDPDTNSPPPGASPPLAGGPGPSAPPTGKDRPPGETPSAAATPTPPAPVAPPAEESPAQAPPPAAPTSPATPTAGTQAPSARSPRGSSAVPVPGAETGDAGDKPPALPMAGGPPASPATPPTAPDGDAAEIAGRADELWQARGRPMGSPEIDWLRAEGELAKAAENPPAPPDARSSSASTATPPDDSKATT